MEQITIPVQRLDSQLDMPAYAYVGDAGLDLRAAEGTTLKPHERAVVATGIALAIPQGFAGFVLPRSGLAAKHGISIVNAPGLIDSNYRGEVKVVLVNLDNEQEYVIKRGDRIAQLVIMATPPIVLTEVSELPESARGDGGFGSSGVAS